MYQPYTTNHKKWDHVGNMTPNVEISEGIRPAEELAPAAYLRLVRFDKYLEDYYVVSAGKVVALDTNGDVVPAGLKYQKEDFATGTGIDGSSGTAIGSVTGILKDGVDDGGTTDVEDVLGFVRISTNWNINMDAYGAADLAPVGSDVTVKNAAGADVENLELVVESHFEVDIGGSWYELGDLTQGQLDGAKATILNVRSSVRVSTPIGIAPYNFFRWAGDASNPANYVHHNYKMQHQVAVLCDYYIELPRIDDKALIQFAGLAVMYDSGLTLEPGTMLKCDEDSDMVPWVEASDDWSEVVGQAWVIDTAFPKDYLDRVRTAYQGLGTLDEMPGSASSGLPDGISYAGGTALKGVVRINLINR